MNVKELEEYMKKIWDKVEIDQKFELQELEKPKIPECIRKWADDFLEANEVDIKTIPTDCESLSP